MKARYVGEKSFWDLNVHSSHSAIFKHMLSTRHEALECMIVNIVDGKTMSLLFDPWLNGSKLVNRLGTD